MAEGNESGLTDEEIQRERRERDDERARAKREEIRLRAVMRGEGNSASPVKRRTAGVWLRAVIA